MQLKCIVKEVDTSSAFARSVPIARPKGMVVEVNDEDDGGSRAAVTTARALSTHYVI
jgi:hypothetical protein